MLFRRAVSKSNASRLLSCWCSLGRVLGTDGGLEVKIERLPGLHEDEKLAELISEGQEDWEALRWWTFWREPGGLLSYPEDVASDKRLDVTSVISCGAFLRLFCIKA